MKRLITLLTIFLLLIFANAQAVQRTVIAELASGNW
jgi:hypothetical protein